MKISGFFVLNLFSLIPIHEKGRLFLPWKNCKKVQF